MSALKGSGPLTAVWADPLRVAGWLQESGCDLTPPVRIDRIGIGQSNITSLVTDAAGGSWVLREPPKGASGTAHDMRRETRMLDALADTGVPVPRVVARGAFGDGRAFFAMTRLPGTVLESEADGAALSTDERASIGVEVPTVLARLHALDPAAVGLDDLVSRTPYAARQLRRVAELWQRVGVDSSHGRVWAILLQRLQASMPIQDRSAVVHGDYRLSNLLVAEGRVTGVLDWELSAVGDPLVDLAWLVDDWRSPVEKAIVMPSPTRAGGFGSRLEVIDRYVAVSGRRIEDLGYYRALTHWRAASLLRGVLVRRRSGVMGNHGDLDLELLEETIGHLLDLAGELLERRS